MTQIDAIATNGINRIFDYGLAMTILVIVGILTFHLVKYLLNRCDERFTQSLDMQKDVTKQMAVVVEQNTRAYNDSTKALQDLRFEIINTRALNKKN